MSEFAVPLLVAAIFFVLFRRIRRLFGRQRLSVPRLLFRIVLAGGVLTILVLLPSSSLIARALGVAVGAALAVGGVLTSKTERVGEDRFYRPNPIFGMVIVALLLGRLAHRLLMARGLAAMMDGSAPGNGFAPDPWSRFLVIAVFSYSVFFHLGILGRSRLGLPTLPR